MLYLWFVLLGRIWVNYNRNIVYGILLVFVYFIWICKWCVYLFVMTSFQLLHRTQQVLLLLKWESHGIHLYLRTTKVHVLLQWDAMCHRYIIRNSDENVWVYVDQGMKLKNFCFGFFAIVKRIPIYIILYLLVRVKSM